MHPHANTKTGWPDLGFFTIWATFYKTTIFTFSPIYAFKQSVLDIFRFKLGLMKIFWTLKFGFDVNIMSFFLGNCFGYFFQTSV